MHIHKGSARASAYPRPKRHLQGRSEHLRFGAVYNRFISGLVYVIGLCMSFTFASVYSDFYSVVILEYEK